MMYYYKLYELVVSNLNEIDNNKLLTYNIKIMSKAFKNLFSNKAKSPLVKLPDT